MSVVRLRRLQADHLQLTDFVRNQPRLQLVEALGDPPERYQIEYRIRSLRQVGNELSQVKSHLVEILLPRNYPRVPPACRMLTPVFHPNIAPHAICIGDHWSAGEPLISIVARIGEMLAFQSYNVKSPLNGEAARWVDQHLDDLPLDPISLVWEAPAATQPVPTHATKPAPAAPARERPTPERKPQSEPQRAEEAITFAEAPPPPEEIRFSCPDCGAKMKAPGRKAGTLGHCPQCQAQIMVPRS